MLKLKTKIFACFSAAILLYLIAVGPVMSLSGHPFRASETTTCLSPKLGIPLSVLSEREFLRLKTKFEQTRDPEDLYRLLKALNPLFQKALEEGLSTDFAVEKERKAQGKTRILFPATTKLEDKEVVVKNNDLAQAAEEFFQINGHRKFYDKTVYTNPAGPYQIGNIQQSYYPFCCLLASSAVENLLLNIDGLEIFHLLFSSSSNAYATHKHYATLVTDIYTGNSYYISLTDGQFIEPTNADGTLMQTLQAGYAPSKESNGYLGGQRKNLYTNPEYIKWFKSKGLDRLYFVQVPFDLDPDRIDTPAILNLLHRKFLIPDDIDWIDSTQTVYSYNLDACVLSGSSLKFVASLPEWMAGKIAPDSLRLLRQIQTSS